jgi:hypothetical protein
MLNTNGATDSWEDESPQIIKDKRGVLHVVWDSSNEVFYASASTNYTSQLFQWVPSFSGSEAPELARGGMRASDGAVMADVKDASTSSLLRNVFFTGQYAPISLAVVPSFSGTSATELVMLQRNQSTGAVCGDVRDVSTGAFFRRVWFHHLYNPLDIESLENFGGTTAPEIATLARRLSDGAIGSEVRDASSGALIKRTHFHADFLPVDIEVVPDFGGTTAPELVVLGQRESDGAVAGGIRDASTGVLLKRVFFDNTFTPLDIEVMLDFADSSAPELAVLGNRRSTNTVTGEIRDASTGNLVNAVLFDSSYWPVDLEVVPDFGGTTAPELVMLGERYSDNAVVGEARDASSGDVISAVSFSSAYRPNAIEVLPSFGDTSAAELAVHGVNSSAGVVIGEVKDASSGTLLKYTFFNPNYVSP